MSPHRKQVTENAPADVPSGLDRPESAAGEQAASEEQKLQADMITNEAYQQLQKDLEQARAKAAESFEGWQRERADFMNYKKRIERDQAQSLQNISGNIIKRYLPVVDDLDRALKNRPREVEAAAWAEGIELIYRKLQSILAAEGVQTIPAEGQQFDPNSMEAITYEDSPDHESGQVIEIVQQGYTLGDRVIRPARVRVAR